MYMAPMPGSEPLDDDIELDRYEGAFRSVFETAPYGMLLIDDAGRIVAVNERASAMFGYPAPDLLGEGVEKLLPHRFRAGHAALMKGYKAAPSVRAMGKGRDLTGRRSDGIEFPLEIGLSSILTPHGRVTCVSIVDITDRKRDELRLREVNAQLEEFTYVASHDLRSPIRGIANLIGFIREDYGDAAPPDVIRNLARMDDRVDAIEKLIGDLLTYARAGRGSAKIEQIVLGDLVDEIVAMESVPAGMSVTTDLTEEPLEGARVALMTVIRNLVSNAVKHHDLEEGHIAIRAHLKGSECLIEVQDDGPGIPVAAQQRVFRLFQTLNASERKGVGLGLAVVQRLVDRHGGKVGVDSRDGERGTVFRVSWPRYPRTDLDD